MTCLTSGFQQRLQLPHLLPCGRIGCRRQRRSFRGYWRGRGGGCRRGSHEPVLTPEKILNNVTKENYPKEGITFKFVVQTDPKDKYLAIKEAHLRSFLTEGVDIQAKYADGLIITFNTYESLLLYSKFLVAFFSGLSKLSFSSSPIKHVK